jgi:hypothetical protein
MSFDWGPEDLVVVPAIFDRWGYLRHEKGQTGFDLQPFWAFEDPDKHRHVFLYQRVSPKEPFFVPNYGFEGTVYLRFIVDHYDNLPPVMVFLQDDFAWTKREDCLRRDLGWRPLDGIKYIKGRNMGIWMRRGNLSAFVEQCWRDFAEIFKLPPGEEGFQKKREPVVSFYGYNNFAVGRRNILKRPLAEWKAAYEKAISPVCHNGTLDLQSLSERVLNVSNFTAGQEVREPEGITKDATGGALEHLAIMIYGFRGMDDEELDLEAMKCEHFLPSSTCPESPCVSRRRPRPALDSMETTNSTNGTDAPSGLIPSHVTNLRVTK